MGCEGGRHLWTAQFYQSGSLAFWFCSRCGDTYRDVGELHEPLEPPSAVSEDSTAVTIEGETPESPPRRWKLSDGSVLTEGFPASISFRGVPLPGIPDSHSYVLELSGGGERHFTPMLDRSSARGDCCILTRYRVLQGRLVKYRIHCCENTDRKPVSVQVDEPSENTILSGLEIQP